MLNLKSVTSVLSGFTLSFLIAQACSAKDQNLKLDSMLIIGSSVSADHSALSPGKYIAQQLQINSGNTLVKAKGGVKSTYHTNFIKNKIENIQPDITIAVDLFFHDFKIPRPYTKKNERWIVEVVAKLTQSSNIVVIGTALGFNGLGGATDANNTLTALANQYDNLYLVDVNTMFQQLHSSNGFYYNINGIEKTFFRDQVLADFIHPNKLGSKVLANLIINNLRQQNPKISEEQLPYLEL